MTFTTFERTRPAKKGGPVDDYGNSGMDLGFRISQILWSTLKTCVYSLECGCYLSSLSGRSGIGRFGQRGHAFSRM